MKQALKRKLKQLIAWLKFYGSKKTSKRHKWNKMEITAKDITKRKHGGNEQSVAAQIQRKPKAQSQRNKVYLHVKAAGLRGITADELATQWGEELNRISGRFTELGARGIIERRKHQGKRITRKTRTGSQAAVWFATP